jgi:hypothetical protein
MSYFDKNRQKGEALLWSLIVLALGSLFIIPMLNYVTTGVKSSQISKESLVSEYSAEAGFEWAMWQLMHTDSVVVSTSNPIWESSVDINGITIPVILTLVPLGEFVDEALPGVYIDYTIPAGHYLEMKVIVPWDVDPRPQFNIWFAYDTELFPAQILLPTPTETVSYYWHNNPTPPISDTSIQHPLYMDTTVPTADTLYNYDINRDNDPGRLINQGGVGPDEDHPNKMQEWRTTAPFAEDFHIKGKVGLLYWWGMKNFDASKTAAARFYLRDYDGSSYTEIGSITHVESEWARLFDFRSTCRNVTIAGRIKLFADRVEILSWNIE